MIFLLIFVKFWVTICLGCISNADNVVILKSNETAVIGRKLFTIFENNPYAAFWKIPYAEAPVGQLRFKPPKAKNKGVNHIVNDYTNPYNETCSSGFTEDCLYLSIYMPINNNGTRYPIMVWINEHSNFHGPDFLIDEEILVITVSYRTGLFGFLNTGDDFGEGNMGIKDLIMALKWIRNNVSVFNGDFNKITLMGSGTGAIILASFVLSNTVDELFTRLIIQSGSALSPADYKTYNFEIVNKLWWNLNGTLSKFNRKILYEILSNATIPELLLASHNLFDSTEVRNRQRLINTFGPTVEISNKHAFLIKPPLDVYKRRMANNNVEVMIGYNNLEALYKLKCLAENKKLLKYLNYNFQYLLPFEGMADEYGSRRYKKIKQEIMNFCFVNGTIGERSLRRYAKYVSDQVIYPVLRQARLQAEVSCNNVYLYRFSFKGAFNIGRSSSVRNLNLPGATFGDEICYLFRCKSVNDVYNSGEASNERHFIKKIARLWANFAKCGNPTPNVMDEVTEDLQWKPLHHARPVRGINLSEKIKMIRIPEEKRMKFWDQLKENYFPDDEVVA